MGEIYKGTTIPEKEMSIIKELEQLIGETIPKKMQLEEKGLGYVANNGHITELNLSDCSALEALPENFINLKYLKKFVMIIDDIDSGFGDLSPSIAGLDSLPENFGNLEFMECLKLEYCKLKELPISFGNLKNLKILHLNSCINLSHLPDSFCELENLEEFYYNVNYYVRDDPSFPMD